MPVIPVRLGEPPRQLFALMQPAGGATPRQHGVLLCNPFGQEAIRAHRLVRVLGDRLSAAGFAVMRFDYFGTGDSDGDDDEGDMATWIEDVRRADESLLRLGGVRERSWFGLRLGASLAALASAHVPWPPSALVLWDPVTDGPRYLAELAEAHGNALRLGAAGLPTAQRLSRPGERMEGPGDEALGFPLTPRLRADLGALVPSAFDTMRAGRIEVILSAGTDVALSPRAGPPLAMRRVDTAVAWATDEAMNSAIVPADAMQAILASLTPAGAA